MHTGLVTLALASAFASVAASAADGFPDGAKTLSAAEVKQRFSDKIFTTKLASGVSWRLEYKSDGYFYVDTSTGFRGAGQWQAADGQLCGQLKGRDHSCNEVRVHQDQLLVQQKTGEVLVFAPG